MTMGALYHEHVSLDFVFVFLHFDVYFLFQADEDKFLYVAYSDESVYG